MVSHALCTQTRPFKISFLVADGGAGRVAKWKILSFGVKQIGKHKKKAYP